MMNLAQLEKNLASTDLNQFKTEHKLGDLLMVWR